MTIEERAGVISTETRAKYNALSAEGDRDIYHGQAVCTNCGLPVFHESRKPLVFGKLSQNSSFTTG
ncbi:MAG: hypothetical protein IJ106_13695 [Parasporobacterium sp.]|nr:hypothetical protein [Parasporobacterium sp.]